MPSSERRFRIPIVATAVAAGILLGAAWLSVSLHFLFQVQSADSLRSQADRIRIDLLECRRREKDFLLRSLTDPAFYTRGSTPYLQLHREALGRLKRECEDLVGLVPPDGRMAVKELLAMEEEYDRVFGLLVDGYRRLGTRDHGLEGSLHARRGDLERAIAAPAGAALLGELRQLRSEELEYLLRGDEPSLQAVRHSALRLREEVGRLLPNRTVDLQELLDRYLQALAAYRDLQQEIGTSEELGLQGRFRKAAHQIEPIVSRVVEIASTEYGAAIRRMRGGILTATVLLSALLSTTFFLTRTARLQSRHLSDTASELSRSNLELQQFAYVASHDLQEPLRAVAGCVQLLEQRWKGKGDAKSDELIRHTVEGCVRMQTLIEDLLTLSRIGTRGQSRVTTDAGRVLQAALENLAISIRDSGATLTHDVLPTLDMDPTQMLQVFQNLIGNALKFHGPRPPVIHIGARRQERAWCFSVRDNGIGIEARYFERIFRVFQRLHSREEYPGSGIGLAVCEKIILRHGGRIWLESEPDRGTTFYFTIPDRGDAG
jgi:signal transduction histidine kinase